MDLLLDLRKHIPDRWFYRRLLPAALFVVTAVVGDQLGQRHWDGIGRARAHLADALRPAGDVAAGSVALLVMFAAAVTVCALAAYLLSGLVTNVVSGEWPWWSRTLRRRFVARRVRRWTALGTATVKAADSGEHEHARELANRQKRIATFQPRFPTWSGDRLATAEMRVATATGIELATAWTWLMLLAPDGARGALRDARDTYDAACEAMTWGIAVTLLGFWWWPAALTGLAACLGAWRWLRHAVAALCETAEAVVSMHAVALADALAIEHPDGLCPPDVGHAINQRIRMTP